MDRITKLFDQQVKPLLEGQPQKVKKQVQGAFFLTPPKTVDEVDAWFFQYLDRAPLSDDGMLLRRISATRAMLREAVSA